MHNVRRLTAESIAAYRDWLKKGATGPAPSQLLTDAGVWDWFFLFYINALAPLAADATRDMKQLYPAENNELARFRSSIG